jgi:hypothetical protein
MKKQIIGGLFVLIALFFTVVSCRKDAQTVTTEPTQTQFKVDAVKGDFYAENGILHFKSYQALQDVLEQLKKFDMSERQHLGKKIGFKSLLSTYIEVQLQCADAQDEKTHKSVLLANADIIDASLNDGTFVMRIANKDLAAVLNREGIIYIGTSVYEFTEFGEAIAIDGDIQRLKTVNQNTQSDKNIKVFIANKLDIRAPCGVGNFQRKVNGSKRSELSFSRLTSYFFVGFDANDNPLYTVSNGAYTDGVPYRKNFWGNWSNYRTGNTLSGNYNLTSYNGSCNYGDNFSYSNNWTGIDFMGSTCNRFNIPEASLSSNFATYVSANNTYSTDEVSDNNVTCQ